MNKARSSTSKVADDDGLSMEEVRTLIEKARTGDEDAFGLLVTNFHQRLYGVVYRFVQDADDANELVQQTWIKAWKKLDTFKGNSEFFTWLYRIASYASLDLLRKRKRRREDPLPEFGEAIPTVDAGRPFSVNPRPDRAVEHGEINQRFQAALEQLSPDHRMALVLREVEGMAYDEIARVMKCRKGTVMSRIYYARKNIQEQMAEFR